MIRGEAIDFSLSAADSLDPTKFSCRREYTRSGGVLVPTEVFCDAFVTLNGKEGKIQVEFKRHDWQNEALGKAVTVVLRDNLVDPQADQCWWEYEWHNKITSSDGGIAYAKEYAIDAFEGRIRVELYSGDPADGGVFAPNTGKGGFTGEGTWSETERLTMSLTGMFTTNSIIQ